MMIYFNCNVCRASLSGEEGQAGSLVRCPNCLTTLTVPAGANAGAMANAGATNAGVGGAGMGGGIENLRPPPPPAPLPRQTRYTGDAGLGRRYGFNCVYCSSRLEATESMAAQEGQCPTCGSNITIPILDRYGRLIDPITKEIIKPDPHPVHAYAAAGQRAPQIIRHQDGSQVIQCTKCVRVSPINSNNCKHCGMPFTMEGTTPEAAGASNGFAVTSLVLGIIGVPFSCSIIVPLLAVVFGGVALVQISQRGSENASGRGLAIAGVVCGCVGLIIGVMYLLN
ncbi:MAG: DUF4190 domain-containing protein [Burkholderiales bacterium]|nr:DUF4190 domain-containing protein [Phycisphaerae bacterium]